MKSKKFLFAIIILVVIAAICLRTVFSRKSVNVLLISMDTTRADRLGCYGYDKNTTPNIDSFAAESILFKSAVAPIPFTFPSHLSMMTGTIPPYHGQHDNDGATISDTHLTLAEVLKGQGYKTGAILASYVLAAKFGLNQGFDTYTDFSDRSVGTTVFCNGRRACETARLANEWIEENKGDKFFLFAHFYDPHFPYDPPEGFIEQFKDSPYDGEIASVDHAIGRILDKLKELDLYDNTIIIITGDHGEMLGEHQEAGHGYYIYEGAIKVPLIVKLPGSGKSIRVDKAVGLIDIFPTVCSRLGIGAPDFVQGIDLSGYLKTKTARKDRYLFTESLSATKFGGNSLLGVVTNQHKYIQTTRPELYDVQKDPAEENNLIKQESKRARLMQGNLKLILDNSAGIVNNEKTEVGLETKKQLESLGYIGGQVDASLSFDQTKPDPKDLLYQYNMLREVLDNMVVEDFKSAEKWRDKLLAERPDLELVQQLAAKLWLAKVRYEPDKAKAYEEVADMFFGLKEYDRAIKNWTEVLKEGGDSAELRKKLAAANLNLKNNNDAIDHLKISLKMKPDQADVHLALGEIFSELGDSNEAIKYWKNSVKINSAQPALHDKLAIAYYQKGDIDKVVKYWTKAVELEPENVEILNNLAWLGAATKDANIRNPKKALEYALRACKLTKYKQANFVDSLSVAYAANGQYPQAVENALKALELAISDGRENLVDEINKRLELYKAQQPYYDVQK